MPKSKSQNKSAKIVFMYLSIVASILLFAGGCLAWWAHSFTSNMVKTELTAQKIYFPKKGSPNFDPKTFPELQKYAGEIVNSPEKAKAYANGYIGRHLKKVAGGKVYSEVSAEAMKNPSNEKLQQQKQTLFQGETLRTMLLTSGYGFGTLGKVAGVAAYTAFIASAVLLALAAFLRTRV